MYNTVAFHIGALHRSFMKYSTQVLKEKGINQGQLPFILYVGKHPGCSPSELKHNLKIDWGYSQRAITKLVENEILIKELTEEADCYRLDLTEKGQEAFNACYTAFQDWDDEYLSMLTDEEKAVIINLLHRALPPLQGC